MKTYLLTHIDKTRGRNNFTLYRIHWLDTELHQVYETTVDESYRNWHKWQAIVQSRSPEGYYSGLKRSKRITKEGIPVMSADSKPVCVQQVSPNEVRAQIQEILYPPKNTFNNLFETV